MPPGVKWSTEIIIKRMLEIYSLRQLLNRPEVFGGMLFFEAFIVRTRKLRRQIPAAIVRAKDLRLGKRRNKIQGPVLNQCALSARGSLPQGGLHRLHYPRVPFPGSLRSYSAVPGNCGFVIRSAPSSFLGLGPQTGFKLAAEKEKIGKDRLIQSLAAQSRKTLASPASSRLLFDFAQTASEGVHVSVVSCLSFCFFGCNCHAHKPIRSGPSFSLPARTERANAAISRSESG